MSQYLAVQRPVLSRSFAGERRDTACYNFFLPSGREPHKLRRVETSPHVPWGSGYRFADKVERE